MENKKLILFYTTSAVIVFLTVLTIQVSALSETSRNTFSFRFEECTVNDALKEISEKSGIKIIANGTLKKEIYRKSYVNRSLDSIIANLLRGENCALVWNYNDGNLHSIDLYTIDENDLKRTGTRSTAINRTNRNPIPGNRDINELNEIRNNYLNNRNITSRSRSNRSSPASSRSVVNSTSKRNNTNNRSSVYGSSRSTNTESNSVSGTSSISANVRRASINKQNNETKNKTGEDVNTNNPESSPEPPEPEKSTRLEPPPMPPGL